MNKYSIFIFTLLLPLFVTGCVQNVGRTAQGCPKNRSSKCAVDKVNSVDYKLATVYGELSTIHIKYSAYDNINQIITHKEVLFAHSLLSKEDYESAIKSSESTYGAMDGVTYTATITDQGMTETLDVDFSYVSNEDLSTLYGSLIEDRHINIDDYTHPLEEAGYSKE